jgi:hypothetical protein
MRQMMGLREPQIVDKYTKSTNKGNINLKNMLNEMMPNIKNNEETKTPSIFRFIIFVGGKGHHRSKKSPKNWKHNLSSSFASVTREYEMIKAQKKFEVPNIGRYNARFNITEARVKGLNFSQTGSITKSKRQEVDNTKNTSPICGRMIRALNTSSDGQKVGTYIKFIFSSK